MSDKPEDISQWIWDLAGELIRIAIPETAQEDVSRAILQARSKAFEEAAKIADCGCNNPGCERDEIAQAIRQHSQKGIDHE